jgi:hypothetical protein
MFKKIFITTCILIHALTVNLFAQDSTQFKPSGKLWGYAFGDYAYKAHGDTVGGSGRGGANQYSNVAKDQSLFQMRRVYLGYNYDISRKFSAEFLLAAEDDFNGGDLLSDGKFAPYVKLANLRWKNIFPGSDFVFGLQPTPAFSSTSEPVWGYRSIERTILDVRRTSSFDLGASLQGHLPKNDNFNYTLMMSNGSGARPEGDALKWFWADVNYKFLNKRLIVDVYADYARLNLQQGWHHERSTTKLFVGYTAPLFSVGGEAFISNLNGDGIGTRTDGKTRDTLTTKAVGISLFARGRIYKDQLGFFARYDNYNPSINDDNANYVNYAPLTSQYNPNTKEQFITAGIDYTPVKNVHIMPNIWYNTYSNAGPKNYGDANKDHDLVLRLTFYYVYGK